MILNILLVFKTSIEEQITSKELESKNICLGDFILFKTINSNFSEFRNDFVYLDKSVAEYLVDKGIIGVGIDSLGIERNQPNHITHKLLLGNNISILEGLRLKGINQGNYFLFAAPIKIKGSDGGPTRAVLVDFD